MLKGETSGAPVGDISVEELQLATRNHGMPLEVLRYPLTPLGLHYVLVHYDIPAVEVSAWRLRVEGRVERPLALTIDELRAMASSTVIVTMECAGNGRARLSPRPVSQPWLSEAVGTAAWRGVAVRELLDQAGVADDGAEVVFTGCDRGMEGGVEQDYARSLHLDQARRDEVIVAYEVNGSPLPLQHGFPLRLVVPGWYGMTNVKWLRTMTVLNRHFDGFQQAHGYRFRTDDIDPGLPLSRMAPRALMIPPGIPEFLSRRRLVPLRPCLLEGRAWSGWGPIVDVDVSADGGATWAPAQLGDHQSDWSWLGWQYQWQPHALGDYQLCCRARDAAGNQQPFDGQWNMGGYANNGIQRVAVTVVAR